jgi:AAA+ superfamily predicted ATPase
MASANLFDEIVNYPDPDASTRYQELVGIDEQKARLVKFLATKVNPNGFIQWIEKKHPNATNIVEIILKRPPLVVLEGDVGTGKSALAKSVGDAIARQEKMDLSLYPLSLASRGQGRVGEMTQLIAEAFSQVATEGSKLRNPNGKHRGGIIFLIDEADALAQSRENSQMHHEDKAGVNAFIRGVDKIAKAKIPVAVIMCTNRISSLDPAVKRRAADILTFTRPNDIQRQNILQKAFVGTQVSEDSLRELGSV